jgi:putative ABC transport system ATP-binding protein
VSRGAAEKVRAEVSQPEAPAIDVRSLYRFFRAGDEETLALQGLTFTAQAGEVLAVVGPSGSGKSTLLACLAGLDEPDGGSVTVAGQRISHRPEPERARLRAVGIGILMQNGNLIAHLTVRANVALAQHVAGRVAQRSASELLAAVGLAHRADAYPSTLSGGEAARAGLAVALANDPAVLLADEPTGELDSTAEASVLHLLLAAAQRGAAVVVASHSPAVAAVAHRVVTLTDGRIVP